MINYKETDAIRSKITQEEHSMILAAIEDEVLGHIEFYLAADRRFFPLRDAFVKSWQFLNKRDA